MPRKKIIQNIVEYNKAFPSALRQIMQEHGTTQEELAAALGVKRQTISGYADGSSSPNWEGIAAIAKYFDVSADWLLGASDVRTTQTEIKAICEYTGLSEQAVFNLHQNSQNNEIIRGIDAILSYSINRFRIFGRCVYRAMQSAHSHEIGLELLDYVPEEKRDEIAGYISQWGGKLLSPYQLYDYYASRAVDCLRSILEGQSGGNATECTLIEAAKNAATEAAKKVVEEYGND